MENIVEQSNELGESIRAICSSVNIGKISSFLIDKTVQIDIENFNAAASGFQIISATLLDEGREEANC
jgi:hypothetical protein